MSDSQWDGSSGFESLVSDYQKRIFNTVYQMVRNAQDAEDITQTVFVKAYESRERINPKYRVYSWLYRIAMNESLNFLKRETRARQLQLESDSKDPSQELRLFSGEIREAIRNALDQLTPNHRAVLVLKHFQDCSYKEISEILEISVEKVRSRLFEARKQVQAALMQSRCLPR